MKNTMKLLFVLVCAVILLSACMVNPAGESPTQVSNTPTATTSPVCANTPTATLVPTETVASTATVAATATSVATPEPTVTVTACGISTAKIVSDPTVAPMVAYYFQDDKGFGRIANDVDLSGASNIGSAFRWWQAIYADKNGSKNIPWTHLIADPLSSTSDVTFSLVEPTKYQIGFPTNGASFQITLIRDMNATKQLIARGDKADPDPYTVALQGDLTQKNQTQLSWYISGNGYLKTTKGWIDLSEYSAVEIAFPRELKQGLVITIVNSQSGTVQLWQGSSENCFVPVKNLHKDVPLIQVQTINVW